ncbi:MAG: primosomal protein N' [Deltaproteobacteria bacterium]|nr:primosomal protein N' [Deltaproteobacteria bacterium]
MIMTPSFVHIALFSAPYGPLTYAVPVQPEGLDWSVGLRVLVPVGHGVRAGVVVGHSSSAPEGMVVKPVLWPLELRPLLKADYLDMARQLELRQADPVGKILGHVIPREFRRADPVFELGPGEILDVTALAAGGEADRRAWGLAWNRGEMRVKFSRPRTDPICRVAKDPPWSLMPAAKRQWRIMELLWERGQISRSELTRALGRDVPTVLRALEARGLVTVRNEGGDDSGPISVEPVVRHVPNQEQASAVSAMLDLFTEDRPRAVLLHGVTGSGKTLVYLETIRFCLEAGRWAMLLAPEIAIALQLQAQARALLGPERVLLFHGSLPQGSRQRIFEKVAVGGEPRCVVGTRSALFLPMPDPGVVVLDEEHDASFKQDERLVYHAKDLAWFRIHRSKGLMVLGSATPDVKTFHSSQNGAIARVELAGRVGPVTLPRVRLVDLTVNVPIRGPLSAPCHQALMATLEAGHQAIIMHNRRGYSPVLVCEDCNEPARCEHCHVSLTFHKARNRAVCHYCGQSVPVPLVCASCGSTSFLPMGTGTEKLEEYLSSHLPPETGVLRLDRDTSRRQGSMEDILEAFARGRSQVLVGTQMLSKGHDFPNVTLVLVIDADLGLSLPDYRATERTFQLLVQVAGRAGRGASPGEVYIQTRNPDHYLWTYVLGNDYEGFYGREIGLRGRMSYPPFVRLGLIRFAYPVRWPKGQDLVEEIGRALRDRALTVGARVLGPAPAPLALLKGRLRQQCMIKAQDWGAIRDLYRLAEGMIGTERRMRIVLDLDPVSML